MDFASVLSTTIEVVSNIPFYVPIISFSVILLTFILNKEYLWTIPKLSFLFGIIMTIYDVIAKTPGESITNQIKTYVNDSKYNYNFLHVYASIFLFCIIIAFVFDSVDKFIHKINLKSSNLPK